MKRKLMALLLGATMLIGSVLPVSAADVSSNDAAGSTTTDAYILSLNVTKFVVPTNLQVVFNPENWAVKIGDETKSNQILSTNYGILNKSSKAKKFDVQFAVEDLNGDKIEFVDAEAKATDATDDKLYLYLEAVPGQITSGVSTTTSGNDLANVASSNITTVSDNAVSLHSGSGNIEYVLDKATYELAGDAISANSISSNTVSANLASVSSNGAYSFTFDGAMNTKADWSQLNSGIRITVTYDVEDAAYDDVVGIQDGGVKFTGGNGIITYTGDVESIVSVMVINDHGGPYNALEFGATVSDGTITMGSFMDFCTQNDSYEAVITYKTEEGNIEAPPVTFTK